MTTKKNNITCCEGYQEGEDMYHTEECQTMKMMNFLLTLPLKTRMAFLNMDTEKDFPNWFETLPKDKRKDILKVYTMARSYNEEKDRRKEL